MKHRNTATKAPIIPKEGRPARRQAFGAPLLARSEAQAEAAVPEAVEGLAPSMAPESHTEGAAMPAQHVPTGPAESRYTWLEREHVALRENLNAPQADLAEPQQINAKLKRKIAALETELREAKAGMTLVGSGLASPGAASQVHPPESMAKVPAAREVRPEGAEFSHTSAVEGTWPCMQEHVPQRHKEAALKAGPDAFRIAHASASPSGKPAITVGT